MSVSTDPSVIAHNERLLVYYNDADMLSPFTVIVRVPSLLLLPPPLVTGKRGSLHGQ